MTPERFRHIRSLFEAALSRDTASRGAFLEGATAGDPSLREEVEQLLAAHRQPMDLLEQGVPQGLLAEEADRMKGWRVVAGRAAAQYPVAVPASIGRYRILRLLGEGGMGTVYEAEQEQPRRTVALKVIRPGLAGPDSLRRFEQECQALGRLQHPGIAQIYEAGTADSGCGLQPYFAMELVHGESLLRYAEAHQLGVRQRLELLAKVCDAVQHAHQRGIIHRDLKPGNILVDENGQPKILDFGVARVTGTDAEKTDTGQIIGTLVYMSPEQLAGDALDLDTRSDVYALGVNLFELLAGRLPHQIREQLNEAIRAIREEDPQPLGSINRSYRGDIETIAGKALQRDKGRRYASAADLAADIRRHLNDEPITARPPTLTYHLQKFARRYRALVAGVSAVFLALVAGVLVSTWEAGRARQAERVALEERGRADTQAATARQAEHHALQERDRADTEAATAKQARRLALEERDRADSEAAAAKKAERLALQERDRADNEAAIANAVNNFLQNDVLGQANPRAQLYTRDGPDLKVRTALDRAAARVTATFGDKPLVEAAIQKTIGDDYVELGLFADGRRHLERAVDLRRRYLGDEDPNTLGAMGDLAHELFRFEHKYSEAEPLLTRVLEVSRRTWGEHDLRTLQTMTRLGDLYRMEGKLDQAEPLLTKALEGLRPLETSPNEHSFPALVAMNDLALVYERQGKIAEAEQLFSTAVDGFRRQLGNEHPETLNTFDNLGLLYRNQGEYAQAEPLFTAVVEVRRRVLGDENAETQASMVNLASIYAYEGKYAQAEPLFLTVLEVRSRVLGPEHPDTLTAMSNLAQLYEDEGEYAKADPLRGKVLEVARRLAGPEHPPVNALISLGGLRVEQHQYPQGEILLREALDDLQKANSNGWNRYRCEALLGESLAAQGQFANAEPWLLSAHEGAARLETSSAAARRFKVKKLDPWIVHLYQSWGEPQKAAEWQRTLDDESTRFNKPGSLLSAEAADSDLGTDETGGTATGGAIRRTNRIYSADFHDWPTVDDSQYGSIGIGPESTYILRPKTNTWLERHVTIPRLGGDFVLDLYFRITERHPSSALRLRLAGTGNDADSVIASLGVWSEQRVTYSLLHSRLKRAGVVVPPQEEVIADRVLLPASVAAHDWAGGGKISLKREGGRMTLFVNDESIRDFDTASFPFTQIGLSAALPSTIEVTSVEATQLSAADNTP